MIVALTRAVPPSIGSCEVTYIARTAIDQARAARQHAVYEAALAACGCTVRRVAPEPELPDSLFVEDTCVVLPEIAIIARPGAASRRGEVTGVASVLKEYRPLEFIEAPGTLDGGDVLRVGRRIWIGRSRRTNDHGIARFTALVTRLGYRVQPVEVSRCLHLKSAVTQVGSDTLLHDPQWVAPEPFAGLDTVRTHPGERHAANALLIGGTVLYPAGHPGTQERLEARGCVLRTLEMDEAARAEGGVTCCSVLLGTGDDAGS